MIVVGEKINGTRSDVQSIIDRRDDSGLLELARAQALAGARFIDINVATGTGSRADEVEAMAWAVGLVARELDTGICIDSADPLVLEAGLQAKGSREALINSAKADDETLDPVVSLAKRFQSPVVGLAMNHEGIPRTAEARVAACDVIATACDRASLSRDMVFFDPLVLPVSTDINQANVTLETIRRVKELFPGSKTVLGLSNVSFGLPDRSRVNSAFLHMAALAGLDAAIADPMDRELMFAVKTANLLMGRDRHCRKYVRAFKGHTS